MFQDKEEEEEKKSMSSSSSSSSGSSSDSEKGEDDDKEEEEEEWIEMELMSGEEGVIKDKEGNVIPRAKNTLPNRCLFVDNVFTILARHFNLLI